MVGVGVPIGQTRQEVEARFEARERQNRQRQEALRIRRRKRSCLAAFAQLLAEDVVGEIAELETDEEGERERGMGSGAGSRRLPIVLGQPRTGFDIAADWPILGHGRASKQPRRHCSFLLGVRERTRDTVSHHAVVRRARRAAR
jgi:hypothetical protein